MSKISNDGLTRSVGESFVGVILVHVKCSVISTMQWAFIEF